MASVEVLPGAALEQVSRHLGDAETGSTITRLLTAANLPQPEPADGTKWRRIYAALDAEQRRTRSGACVIDLIQRVMSPQKWTNAEAYSSFRAELNQTLAFNGLTVGPDGRVSRRAVATTHDEAASETARRLYRAMVDRGGHAEVFKYFRNTSPSTTCLCSAASMLERRRLADSHRDASSPNACVVLALGGIVTPPVVRSLPRRAVGPATNPPFNPAARTISGSPQPRVRW